MTQEEAIKLLVQVAKLAQERGLLKLSEAVPVASAVQILDPNFDEKAEIGGGILTSPR